MQELSQRRIDVRRERVGLDLQGLRGVNASPANVDEACARLREVEMHGRRYLNRVAEAEAEAETAPSKTVIANVSASLQNDIVTAKAENKAERLARISKEASENKSSAFRQGRLTTRTEPEIRTHTSYLIFAVLPREWSVEDEEAARRRWPIVGVGGGVGGKLGSGKDKKGKEEIPADDGAVKK